MRLEKMYLLLGRSHFPFSCSFYIYTVKVESRLGGIIFAYIFGGL